MKKHWIDNLPGDYPRRLRNRYHKYRHQIAGLPFRDYVCRNSNIPYYPEDPCIDISALSSPLSSLYKINIGEYEDDNLGDTMLEGLRKVDTNLQTVVNIISAVDNIIRSKVNFNLIDRESNLIAINKSTLPSNIQVGDWVSRDIQNYTLSQSTSAFNLDRIDGPLNVIGVVVDIDPGETYAVVSCGGVLRNVYTDLIPGETYYISVSAGSIDLQVPTGYYSLPVLTGITPTMGVVDIKLGLFELLESLEDLQTPCIPVPPPPPPIPEYEIKLEEITGEVIIIPSTTDIEWASYLQIREITGEVIHKYKPLAGYKDQFTLSEITGEVITPPHTGIRPYMSSASQMGIKDITGEVIAESKSRIDLYMTTTAQMGIKDITGEVIAESTTRMDPYMTTTAQMGVKDVTGEVIVSANDYLSEYESEGWSGF